MSNKSSKSIVLLIYIFVVTTLGAGSLAQAQSFNVIHNFAGTDGSNPLAGLVMSPKQNLYGTASSGGQYGGGVAFESTLSGTETVLHSFGSGTDGTNPQGSLITSNGYLYGTTSSGGAGSSGTVFKLSPKGVETVLYNFAGGADGANPIAGLAIDKTGNLYGTTSTGGAYNAGTVFEVSSTGQHTVLYSFGTAVNDGSDPVAGVTLDSKGNLYGTTADGGAYTYGTVFELSPSSSGWTETILHNFELQSDGGTPYAGLIFGGSNLYGAATQGGDGSGGGGTVFQLSPSEAGGWKFKVLYGLAGWGISGTFRNLLFDAKSSTIYGTTHCDGTYNSGTVYQLTRSGNSWSYTQLYTFTGQSDGYYLFSNLVMDEDGNLYGTDNLGGADDMGVIFKVTP